MNNSIFINIKWLNIIVNKLKSAIKNKTEVVLRLSSNIIGNSDDKTNFPHKLLLTNRQVANLRKVFANNSSTDIKLAKTRLSKMIQSRGFLVRLLGPLLKTWLPLMKNVIKPLDKSVLIPLGLTAAASAADAWTHKKILGSGNTMLIISNDEMEDIIKISWRFWFSETIQNEGKEQKGEFLSMLLGTLGASFLGNILAGKGMNRAGGFIRASCGSSIKNKDFQCHLIL